MRYLVASEIYRGIHTLLIDPEVVSFETSTLAKRYAMQLGAEVGTFARSAVEPVRENDVTVGVNKHGRMLTSGARTRLRQGDALLDADSDVLLVHRSTVQAAPKKCQVQAERIELPLSRGVNAPLSR